MIRARGSEYCVIEYPFGYRPYGIFRMKEENTNINVPLINISPIV